MAYIYQAPKDLDAQSAAFKRKYPDLAFVLATGNYEAQLKYDGVFSVVYTSSASAESRQQEAQPAAKHLANECLTLFGEGWLVFMELWIPGEKHKTINGAARREKHGPQEQLNGMIFDAITSEEFAKGKSDRSYRERMQHIGKTVAGSCKLYQAAQVVIPSDTSHEEIIKLATGFGASEANAYDGLILRDLNAGWSAGAAKQGEVLKIKPGISLDLRVVGQHAEQRATKLGGHITVTYNGVLTNVGSGLNQEMLEAIMREGASPEEESKSFIGKIAEVECLGITPDGKLREPRLKSFRTDTDSEEEK